MVEVVVRMSPTQEEDRPGIVVHKEENNFICVSDSENFIAYKFDIVCSDTSQKEFADLLAPLMKLSSSSVVAYGSAKSGKTYTMFGSDHNPGLLPRLSTDLVANRDFNYFCSFCEVFEAKIVDLLHESDNLTIRESEDGQIIVENLSEFTVLKGEEVEVLIETGLRKASGSGHLVFQFMIEANKAGIPRQKINFCDLASSHTDPFDKTLESLKEESSEVPYNDSLITFILKDTLNCYSQLIFIACISQIESSETMHTLNMAEVAKKINIEYRGSQEKGKNHSVDISHVERIMKENQDLRMNLQKIVINPLSQDYLYREFNPFPNYIKKSLEEGAVRMKNKLIKEGRCPLCTLKIPCRHYETPLTPAESESISTSPVPDIYKIAKTNSVPRKNVKNKILEYREYKIKREIQKLQEIEEAKAREEASKKKKEIAKKKYFQQQKKKIELYRKAREQPPKLKIRSVSTVRRTPRVLINDFSAKTNIVNYIVEESFKQISRVTPIPRDSLDFI